MIQRLNMIQLQSFLTIYRNIDITGVENFNTRLLLFKYKELKVIEKQQKVFFPAETA
jgi:hypothetical protein